MASKLRGPERLITWWWFVESLVLPLEEGSGAIAALRLGASRASLVRAAVEEAVRIGAPFKAARQGGQLVRAVARAIGAKGLSQAEAVRAIEQALGRLEFESGRLIKDGVVYLAPHSVVEGTEFSAVAVAADGSVGMARLAINGIKVEVVTPAAH